MFRRQHGPNVRSDGAYTLSPIYSFGISMGLCTTYRPMLIPKLNFCLPKPHRTNPQETAGHASSHGFNFVRRPDVCTRYR